MEPLDLAATDSEIVAYIDRWVLLLEAEDYAGAIAMIDCAPAWTPGHLREIVNSYGDENSVQRVTFVAAPTDVRQRKHVDRWDDAPNGSLGEVWYDLGIGGLASDLTATFTIRDRDGGHVLTLCDIHVM